MHSLAPRAALLQNQLPMEAVIELYIIFDAGAASVWAAGLEVISALDPARLEDEAGPAS